MDGGASQNPIRHLADEEIDRLVWHRANRQSASSERAGETEWMEKHLADCAQCSQLIQAREEGRVAMARMLTAEFREPGPNCPPGANWPLVAAGVIDSAELLDHVAECDACARLLREAHADVLSEPTHEEIAVVAGLPSSRPGMAALIVKRITNSAVGRSAEDVFQTPATQAPNVWTFPYWLAAAAGIAVVALGIWVVWRPAARPDQLVARAYSARRTIEWRIPGTVHSSRRVERGGAGQPAQPTMELLRSELSVDEHLAAQPNNPEWLQAKGRLDLLAWRYDSAIQQFQRVGELRPSSEEALIDLAGGYFERAEATGSKLDYGSAIDLLDKVLQGHPTERVALFDRALASERTFLYRQAIQDWEALLKVESEPGWANEAHERLAYAKKKLAGN